MIDIVILTDSRYINPKKRDWYIEQVLTEDKILEDKLQDEGLKVLKKDWADTNFDWKSTKSVIFRTTWDYFERYGEFLRWIKSTSLKTKFINPYNQVIWNLDKSPFKSTPSCIDGDRSTVGLGSAMCICNFFSLSADVCVSNRLDRIFLLRYCAILYE